MRSIQKLFILFTFLELCFSSKIYAAEQGKSIAEKIEANINAAIEDAEERIDQLILFSDKELEATHDGEAYVLVYHRDSLVYWSNFQIALDHQKILASEDHELLQLGPKLFLVCRHAFDNGYTVLSLTLIQSTPSVQNSYLKSGLNEQLFENFAVQINPDSAAVTFDIKDKKGKVLFSIATQEDHEYVSNQYGYLVLYLLVFVCGYYLLSKKSVVLGLFFLIAYRGASLLLEYPRLYFSDWWFDPKVYAASAVSPTLGDFFLNTLVGVLIAYHFGKIFNRKSVLQYVHLYKGTFIIVFSLLLLLTEGFYTLLLSLYKNSQYDFNFFSLTTFPALEVLYAVIFLLLSYVYITGLHGFLQWLKHSFTNWPKVNWLVLPTLSLVAFSLFVSHWYLFVAVLGLVLLGLRTNLSKSVAHFSSTTYVYALLLFICASWVAFTALKEADMLEERINKSKFADQLLNKHDPLGEFLLAEALKDIESDAFIKSIILDPSKSKSVIYQKVQNIFLNKYFDRYNVDIHLFNNRGYAFDESTKNTYLEWEKDFGLIDYSTEYDNVYFHDDITGATSGRLVGFSNIIKNDQFIGSMVIDLKMKKVIPSSVYPKLLLDEKLTHGANTQGYFYGFYKDSALAYSYGNFNYPQQLKNIGGFDNDFDHYLQRGENGELVVVSSKSNRFLSGNFSYHFLLITFIVLLLSILISIIEYQKQKMSLSFAVKIRLFLGGAFFVPLVIITVSLVSIINTNYKQEKEEEIIKTSEGLNDRLASLLDEYSRRKLSLNELANRVNKLSINSGLDQNIYDRNGHLLYSSQPEIFETGLISRLMNPRAFQDIILQSKKYSVLNEQVEELQYNAIYWAIHSNISGELIGVLHLPFYNAKEELSKREFAVFSIVINVFSLILIITVLIYPLTINSLTAPLKLIASKLKKTSFSGENEKIDWKSPDELGLLVEQYNQMIGKLEESKKELAKQEKEHAWREMAKQVAHEIKNPLTPIKLTLQHLQRTEDIEAVKKSINMLLTQVETLNDIATSFSSFAKMPEPESEQFDLCEVLKKGVQLYENEQADVRLEMTEEIVFVKGDRKLMGRILTNLILNGIQSVANGKTPQVIVSLEKKGNEVLLKVADNGQGIPDEVKDKVFIPNFSTKYSGSGIGLAVAKRGVEHAGGKIWFETQKDKGTTFYIQLPIVKG